MRLLAFRVHEFRSVDDSGWIEVDQVTGLIGTNESGKTNVLAPLWKLKPANGGAIDPMPDYPRKRYHEIRALKPKPTFIEARFELPPDLRVRIADLLKASADGITQALVSRNFDGEYNVSFPRPDEAPTAGQQKVLKQLDAAQRETTHTSEEEPLRAPISRALQAARTLAENSAEAMTADTLAGVRDALAVDVSAAPSHSVLAARLAQLQKYLDDRLSVIQIPQSVQDLVIQALPSFVYYSNYGNLDSEIYLPHVIHNLQRNDLGQREQAQVRTLKVLFDFVRLRPEEIKEMGKDVDIAAGTEVTPDQREEIARIAKIKRERDILLHSASTELTRRFRDWWKQGQYRFRFAADGNHFRIWVSDDKRPEDIELESRSTGLQWFFSFYLVFLVESRDAHQGAILLLDEPGLTLHPLAQGDLSEFFDGLGATNQLIYTAHSPFMVDADHLDRARAVYTDENGVTKVSPDLQAPSDNSDRSRSVYAAYAALRMAVSETLLLGCQPVIVEGPSDQHYLSAIKNHLVGLGALRPSRDIVFMPAGGVKGVKAVCALVMGRDHTLPFVLLDADKAGRQFADSLKGSLYRGDNGRVLSIGDAVPIRNCEVEDLFPPKFIGRIVDRYLLKPADVDEDFVDFVTEDEPIVPQVETYAAKYGMVLQRGWKVDVAKRAKSQLLRGKEGVGTEDETHAERWRTLFTILQGSVEQEATGGI